MNAGQRFSGSEWSRILKGEGLVVFGVSLWSCWVLQRALNFIITTLFSKCFDFNLVTFRLFFS